MRFAAILWLALFWAMQAGANVLFKYGTTAPGRYWIGYVAGNALGMSSILVMMRIYSLLQVNLAMALAGGGTFLAVQIMLALAFREGLNWQQCLGIATVMAGMVVVSLGTPAAQTAP